MATKEVALMQGVDISNILLNTLEESKTREIASIINEQRNRHNAMMDPEFLAGLLLQRLENAVSEEKLVEMLGKIFLPNETVKVVKGVRSAMAKHKVGVISTTLKDKGTQDLEKNILNALKEYNKKNNTTYTLTPKEVKEILSVFSKDELKLLFKGLSWNDTLSFSATVVLLLYLFHILIGNDALHIPEHLLSTKILFAFGGLATLSVLLKRFSILMEKKDFIDSIAKQSYQLKK